MHFVKSQKPEIDLHLEEAEHEANEVLGVDELTMN